MKARLLLLASLTLFTSSAFAQKPKSSITSKSNVETIIIDGNGKSETEIEIKNGYLYINGEEVTDVKNTTGNKRIVVENGAASDRTAFPWLRDMENRFPRRAMLGVYTGKTDNDKGTIVQEVIPNSAAAKAGLQEGDVITAINDTAVNSPEDLVNAIKNHQPGDKVNIAYMRSNASKTASVTLARANPTDFFRSYKYSGPDMPEINIPNPFRNFGDNFEDLRGSSKPKLGIQIEDTKDGARIIEINENSPAWSAGLQKGDVIYSFNGKDVRTAADLQSAVRGSATGKKLLVVFERNGKDLETDVILPDDNAKGKM
jgi:S1-C subfamily serine protease